MRGMGRTAARARLTMALAAAALAAGAACRTVESASGGDEPDAQPAGQGGKGAGGARGKDAGAGGATGQDAAATGDTGQAAAGGQLAIDAQLPADTAMDTTADLRPDAAAPAGLGAFVGTWQYAMGEERLACDGRPPRTNNLTGVGIMISPGMDAPLVLANEACSFRFDVMEQVASARAGQTCELKDGTSTIKYALTSWAFSLQGAGAMETSAWVITFTDPSGNLRCDYATSGRLQKLR
jgi:hypothetical protein